MQTAEDARRITEKYLNTDEGLIRKIQEDISIVSNKGGYMVVVDLMSPYVIEKLLCLGYNISDTGVGYIVDWKPKQQPSEKIEEKETPAEAKKTNIRNIIKRIFK